LLERIGQVSDLDLNQPVEVIWLAPDEQTQHETGAPGTVRRFSHMRDAVVFALEGLPERYHGSVRLKMSDGTSLDIRQVKRIYAEIIRS
jgi:hypothetical protein